jgi:hypothetical protein
VCDSKVLHQGRRKLASLERTALAFWTAARGGVMPLTAREVVGWDAGILERHPWYGALDARLPLAADRDDVRRLADRIGAVCGRRGVRILELGVQAVPEEDLNAHFVKTGNKSLTLFESVIPALVKAAPRAGERPEIVCDRQGGRASYAPLLSRAYGGAWVRIAREGPGESLYRVRVPGGDVRVAFVERGEERSFACALASCLAKYARELAMASFNAYFRGLDAGVKPTAGYYTDGKRFLTQVGPALAKAGLDAARLTRTR